MVACGWDAWLPKVQGALAGAAASANTIVRLTVSRTDCGQQQILIAKCDPVDMLDNLGQDIP